tara:strand:- start:301 stop:1167 length:867 start_codon:yes stop_codon:yes gene_type:complete
MNSSKYNLLLFTLFIFNVTLFSQDTNEPDIKYTIGVKELLYDNKSLYETDSITYFSYISQITENIANNLKYTNRTNVVMANSIQSVNENLADNVDVTDNKTWTKKKKSKVNYTVHGSINKIKFINMGIKGYKSQISFTIRIIDNVTNKTVHSGEFESRNSIIEIAKTAAFSSALKTVNEAQVEFFKSYFALRTTIYKIEDASKTSAKTVKINLGKNDGVSKKDQFTVFQIEFENGVKVDEIDIGLIKVKSIGNMKTICQVAKGGKDILSLFDKDNKESLICELKIKKK